MPRIIASDRHKVVQVPDPRFELRRCLFDPGRFADFVGDDFFGQLCEHRERCVPISKQSAGGKVPFQSEGVQEMISRSNAERSFRAIGPAKRS
jgi:hypothetical protein